MSVTRPTDEVTPLTWLRVGYAMFTIGFGANLFAPMLQVYREGHGSSEASLTAMLGVYALGLIPALLYFGAVSDRSGRKTVLLPGLGVAILGSVVLSLGALGWGLPLFLGRVIIGVSVGMGMSAGAAWIKELSTDRPAAGPQRATVSVSAGFGLGPLAAGLIAEFVPGPELVPYVIHIVLTVVAIGLLVPTPETVVPQPEASRSRRRLVPAVVRTRSFFWAIVVWAPWVFGVPTTAFASTPSAVPVSVPFATAFLGFLAFVTMGSGVLIQPTAARLARMGKPGRRLPLAVIGLAVAVVGLALSIAAALFGSAVTMVLAAVVLGSSYGIMMVAGLAEAERFAGSGELGSVIGIFYSLTYLGFFVPFLTSLVVSGLSGATALSDAVAYALVLAFGIVVCLISMAPITRAASRR